MSDNTDLLHELHIDREAIIERKPILRWLTMGLAATLLGLAAFWLIAPTAVPEVKIANAQVIPSSSAGASVLDASGYVTARRQATVSSKITGKVMDVLIEEGMAVKKDQLLATLDASSADAQFKLARSQLEAARTTTNESL